MTAPAAPPDISAAVIGGAAWNLLVDVPRLPTDLRSLHADGYRYRIGGTGAGKAFHLARLGIATRLHALLGDDDAGHRVRTGLEEAGVEVTAWSDPRGTERHLNLMDRHGDRVSISLNRGTADPEVSAEELASFASDADLVFVSLSEYAGRVLPALTASGVPVWVDLHDWDGTDSDFRRPYVEHGRYVFLSDVRLDDPLGTCTRLAADKELVVVTHGRRGATAFFPDREPLFVPPYDAGPVADTNGAGDAFCVGVAYGHAQGWDWPRCLDAGAIVAGGCVTSAELADQALGPAWLSARLQR